MCGASPACVEMAYDAILRNMAVIGEAVKALPDDFRREHAGTPWPSREVVSLRHSSDVTNARSRRPARGCEGHCSRRLSRGQLARGEMPALIRSAMSATSSSSPEATSMMSVYASSLVRVSR